MFSLKKVENLRAREREREEKGTINSAPQSLKRFSPLNLSKSQQREQIKFKELTYQMSLKFVRDS